MFGKVVGCVPDMFASNEIFFNGKRCSSIEEFAPYKYRLCVTGRGNTLYLQPFTGEGTVWVNMDGIDDCSVEIGSGNIIHHNLSLTFWNTETVKASGGIIRIGEHNCFNGTLEIYGPYSHGVAIEIGDHNLFADWSTIRGGSDHAILDARTGERLNREVGIRIGSHIWMGEGCLCLNRTVLPDHCVVGARSIVNKKFTEEHTLIAGAPASVKRSGIIWSKDLVDRIEVVQPVISQTDKNKQTGEPILIAKDVTISYKMGDFREIGIKEWIMRHLTRNYKVWQFDAVNHVSFQIFRGDMLGIIGSNGAGKSTLLKAIAKIMEPSSGSVEVHGNVSALLELGSGFDPDLTVRENTYLRGAMLGYTRKFMDKMYDHIVDYAELKSFEDYSFKQLSSGMQSRLAFSIASLVQPEILILDEVLSVGDGAFQEKSAQKMHEIIQNGAATILVSHSLPQIRQLSTKILWLHKGKQVAFGDDVQGICDAYQAFLEGKGALPTLE